MLELGGTIRIGQDRRGLVYYAFKCRKHGVVFDYPHGFNEYLTCGKCWKEQHLND